jgi:hypothetical protein
MASIKVLHWLNTILFSANYLRLELIYLAKGILTGQQLLKYSERHERIKRKYLRIIKTLDRKMVEQVDNLPYG